MGDTQSGSFWRGNRCVRRNFFLNETLGFIALSHSGGSPAELYRTEDGGATFERVTLPAVEVPLTGRDVSAV